MDIITLDFETYYDKEFSLSKMTTEQYIRDSQFEVIGVAVKVNNGETEWFSGTMQETKKFLQKFDWASSIAVAHNAVFDLAILNWHFDLRPKKIVDTLSMARAIHGTEVGGSLDALVTHYGLGAKGNEVINALGKRRIDFSDDELSRYAGYCINDVELTYKLFCALAPGFPVVELNLIDLTIRMFSEPVLQLDAGVLRGHIQEVQEKKSKLMSNIEADKDQLMSNPQLAEVLRNYGIEPPMKVSPTTGKQTYAFAKSDEGFKALLEHDSLAVQALVSARLGVKSTLEETRTQRFIDIAARGTLPIPLRYYAAHTGRWGGCLVADSAVTVYNSINGVEHKRIVDVLLDDLVWDGEAFVPHDGVAFSGYQEVITWDGITGTPEHVVFTDAGEISLRDAMQGAHRITLARSPTQDDVDAARILAGSYKAESTL